MFGKIGTIAAPLLLLAALQVGVAAAADNVWRVSKSSGEVSLTTADGQQSALADGAVVKPGDNVRTGQTGRVLLTRGEESMLISPNSAMGIPLEKKSDLSTTIIQQAGSILLEVEKRNVKHFSVETPYLAAVVKGTQFRVTVNKDDSRVDVVRGQVEVSDFKSGKYALVQPGQTAEVSPLKSIGLLLSGPGSLSPIQQGTPRVAALNIPAAPAIAPSAPPARMAAPEVQPAHTWSSANSNKDTSWSSMLPSWSKGLMGGGNRKNGNEDIMVAAAISCSVGLIVAFAVGAQRRRKSRKASQGLT
jgi:hypothetical protein